MLASKPRTAVLTPFAAPSNTTQAKTALFRGFLEDSVIFKSLLERRDIGVISMNEQVDETPAAYLLEGIIEVFDEFYSANLAQDTLRGMKENVSRGSATEVLCLPAASEPLLQMGGHKNRP